MTHSATFGMTRLLCTLALGVAAFTPLFVSKSAHAQADQIFSNLTPFTIPTVGPASVYPSVVNVTGVLPGSYQTIEVRVQFSHTFPDDLSMLLVGPQGQRVILMHRAGGGCDVTNVTPRFRDDAAAIPDGCTIQTRDYAPGNYGTPSLSSPAPVGPYGDSLQALVPGNPNGQWKLFIQDDLPSDSGTVTGWEIWFRAVPQVITYQGELLEGGAPFDGPADLRFTLWTAPTGGSAVGSPQVLPGVQVSRGRFSVPLNFGSAFNGSTERWIEVAVNGVPLSPRQAVTPAPRALGALRAQAADNATTAIAAEFAATAEVANTAAAAFRLDAPDGSPINAVFVDANGGVGIGTTTPGALVAGTKLDVVGGPLLVSNSGDEADLLWLANERSWVFRQEGVGAGAALKLESVGGGGNKNFLVQTTGFMGVGTLLPTFKLDVAGNIRCTTLTQTSSAVLKDDVAPLGAGLHELMALEPVSYVWNDKAPEESRGKHDLGLIAEHVATVLPDAVARNADGKPVGIDYSRITVLAVQAIKQQQETITRQADEVAALRARLERLEATLAK
jgi:subtilisin-like proprotein convertase family protein